MRSISRHCAVKKLVRKFLLWKTNKENETDNYPAFVAYHADFSPSRKVPLTREVRVSNSETQILALWHELKEENIKKGWELFADAATDVDMIVQSDSDSNNDAKPVVKKQAKKTTKNSAKKKTAKSSVAESKKKTATRKSANKKSTRKKKKQ